MQAIVITVFVEYDYVKMCVECKIEHKKQSTAKVKHPCNDFTGPLVITIIIN